MEEKWQEQYDLGVRYLSEGKYEEAVIAFTAAIEIDENPAAAYAGLGDAYLALGNNEEAANNYQTAINKNPEQPEIYVSLSNAYEKMDDIKRAKEILINAPENVRNSSIVQKEIDALTERTWTKFFDQGEEYLSAGDYDNAIQSFTLAVEADPNRALAYSRRGKAAIADRINPNLDAAQVDFETAISLNGALVEAWLGLADVYVQRGDNETALDILKRGLEKNENSQALLDMINEIETSIKYNSYGATTFSFRQEYVVFEELPKEEQTFVQAVCEAAIAEDTEALLNLISLPFGDFYNEGNYTEWNEYKIQLRSTGRGESGGRLTLEMRPENGMGYYFDIMYSNDMEREDGWTDRVWIYQVACPCKDWCWNGELNCTRIEKQNVSLHEPRTRKIIGADNYIYTDTTHGNIVEGLRDGEYDIEHSSYIESINRTTTENKIESYHQGLQNDFPAIYSVYEFGFSASLSDDWFIDKLYW